MPSMRRLDADRAVAVSTAVYTLATVTTRNPALMLAAGAMGTLFSLQRRASGGLQAPVLTHLTWSTLMVRYLPPLFRRAHRSADWLNPLSLGALRCHSAPTRVGASPHSRRREGAEPRVSACPR